MEAKREQILAVPSSHQIWEDIQIGSSSQYMSNSERKRSTSFPDAFSFRKESFIEAVTQSIQDPSKTFALKRATAFIHYRSASDPYKPVAEEVTMGKKSGTGIRKMYLAALASLLFALAMGMSTGYSSPATFDMQQRPSSRIKATDDDITWIGSIIALGALVGCLVAGSLADKIGRKGLLIYNSMPFMMGWLLIIYAPTVPVMLAGRFIKGVACGVVSVAVPMYTVEISTPEIRGLLGSSFQGMLTVGYLLVTSIGVYVMWTWLAVISSSAVIVGLVCLCPMPESPRWLVAKGRREDAVNAITFFQGDHYDSEGEVNVINEDLLRQPTGRLTFQEMLHPTVYKPSVLSCSLMFFQQFSGSNAVLFYTAVIFKSAGNTHDPSTSAVIVACIQVVATLLSNALIDKTGRKILILLSGFTMALSMAMLGAFYFVAERDESFRQSSGWMPLVSLVSYIAAFSIGYGPIPWLMSAEMIPVRARSVMSGLVASSNGLFAFAVTKMFKSMETSLKPYGTFWFYCGISLLGCGIMSVFLPETKGKRLEDMQKVFVRAKKSTIAKSSSIVKLKEEF